MLLKPSQSWVYNTAFHLPVLKNTECQLVSRTVPFSHRPGSEIAVESGKKSRKKESLDLLESAQSFPDHLWFSLPIKGPSRILLASVAQLKSLLYHFNGFHPRFSPSKLRWSQHRTQSWEQLLPNLHRYRTNSLIHRSVFQYVRLLSSIQEPTLWRHRLPRTRFISLRPREIPLPRRLKTVKSRSLLQIPSLLRKSIRFPIPSQRNCRISLEMWMKMKSWNAHSRPRLSHRLSLSQIGTRCRSNQIGPYNGSTHSSEDFTDCPARRYDSCCFRSYEASSLPSIIDFSYGFLSKGSNFRFYRQD